MAIKEDLKCFGRCVKTEWRDYFMELSPYIAFAATIIGSALIVRTVANTAYDTQNNPAFEKKLEQEGTIVGKRIGYNSPYQNSPRGFAYFKMDDGDTARMSVPLEPQADILFNELKEGEHGTLGDFKKRFEPAPSKAFFRPWRYVEFDFYTPYHP